MKFTLGGPGEVSCVGDGGEALGQFVADEAGVIEVPDDFQEAIRELSKAKGVSVIKDPKPEPPKRKKV